MTKGKEEKRIRDVIREYEFRFKKSLGQNFLINDGVCEKIALACNADKNVNVFEIGPGIGVLTRKLSKIAKKVVALEIDDRLVQVLNDTMSNYDNVKIVKGDILETDLNKLFDLEFSKDDEIVVCSNLPYYITTPVIMRLLEGKYRIKSITLMIQDGAARRICAPPGTKECGAISAAVSYYSEPKLLFKVSRGSFVPAPKVDSQVITLKVRKKSCVDISDENLFFKIIKAAFSMRRKTIENALCGSLSLSKEEVGVVLDNLNIPRRFRAEQLTIENFADLANAIKRSKK